MFMIDFIYKIIIEIIPGIVRKFRSKKPIILSIDYFSSGFIHLINETDCKIVLLEVSSCTKFKDLFLPWNISIQEGIYLYFQEEQNYNKKFKLKLLIKTYSGEKHLIRIIGNGRCPIIKL